MVHAVGTNLGGIRSIEDVRARCYIDTDTGCWRWGMGRTCGKYPSMWLPAVRARLSAGSVLAYLLGVEVPPKRFFYAACGNPMCMNPEHRKVGTARAKSKRFRGKKKPLDQVLPMIQKKRAQGKLTDAMVAEMRASTEPLGVLAERMGISYNYACEVRSGTKRRMLSVPAASVFTWGK